VVSLDQEGTLFNLASFFTEREIAVCELNSRSYAASYTGAPMVAFQMTILIPASQSIAHLREEFTDFCDKLNLDAIMEPLKS
jgi:glycine cleavage system transcriptional repressor